MKKIVRNISICIITIISLTIYPSKGQKKQNIGPVFHIVADRLADNSGFAIDSIAFRWEKPYAIANTRAEGFVWLKPDKDGKIEFKLPYRDAPYPIQICLKKNGKEQIIIPNSFLTEGDDNIVMKIPPAAETRLWLKYAVHFQGNGAEKYNLPIALLKTNYEIGLRRIEIERNREDLKSYLEQVNQLFLDYRDEAIALINTCKLSSDMKKLVAYEYDQFAPLWNSNFYGEFAKNRDVKSRAIIKDAYNAYKSKIYCPIDQMSSLAPSKLVFQALGESVELSINSPTDTVKLTDIYQRLKTKYSGTVRDILLANFFTAGKGINREVMNGYDQVVFDSLAKEAFEIVELPSARKRLVEQLTLSRGAKVPEASFTDLQGNQVSLASLKGKVVMLDFWGTGCGACAMFHQWFHKEIYPIYKENEGFVYLSVNGDKTKERWEAALKTDHYSSDEYINLNLGPAQFAHPFAKYYNMAAFPFLMVIGKDGKVYSGAVPQDKGMATRILDGALAMPLVKSK